MVLAAPRRRPGPSFDPPAPQDREIPDQVRNDDQNFAVAKWDRALAQFQRAQSVLKAAAHEPDEDLYDALNDAFHNALRRLLRTPAPDLAALARKLDLALDERSLEFGGDAAAMKALKADARRFALRSS